MYKAFLAPTGTTGFWFFPVVRPACTNTHFLQHRKDEMWRNLQREDDTSVWAGEPTTHSRNKSTHVTTHENFIRLFRPESCSTRPRFGVLCDSQATSAAAPLRRCLPNGWYAQLLTPSHVSPSAPLLAVPFLAPLCPHRVYGFACCIARLCARSAVKLSIWSFGSRQRLGRAPALQLLCRF